MTDQTEIEFKPRLVDPFWTLPGEVDGFRRSDDEMFHAMLDKAGAALERGRIECPDQDYVDAEVEFEIVQRAVRQALRYHNSPFGTAESSAKQLEHISDMAEDLVIVSAELLHSPMGPDFTLAEERANIQCAALLIDAVCLLMEQSELISDAGEDLVQRLTNLAWAADAVSGDGELRERAENCPPGLRLAHLELCEAAEPVARRLKVLLATMLDNRQSKAAARLATV